MVKETTHEGSLVLNRSESRGNSTDNPFYLKDPLSNSSQVVAICNVFHCDGLLLCTTKDKRLVVWNACSGETTWINPRDIYRESDYYALGYDCKSSGKQYKILRVDREDVPLINEYEIYDFTSNSWRTLGVATDWFLALYRRGISVKGNTYWVATQALSPHNDFLLSFDFSAEKFQSLSLPRPFPDSILALSVVREEQLCLLSLKDAQLQVLVTTSTGSWSQLLDVTAKYVISSSLFSKGMSFLADKQSKVVRCLNSNVLYTVQENKDIQTNRLGRGKRESITHDNFQSSSVLLDYAPSFTQTQQGYTLPGGRKRKSPRPSFSTCNWSGRTGSKILKGP
ncbi:putative F-box protein At3g23260 [Raphanus sativus]|uniref:F-box protein At3g23260 n=1 Tax=Raphanus sativus TaxID=3726 RepID=A0A9W3BQQ0_RAPSA|nr:putative F-box protein At3g23260 [Raphanus sativus]